MARKLTEKFTERAKLALSVAAKEAKQLGSGVIDTEHILLGILADETSVAAKVLASFQVDSLKIRESVLASTENQKSKTEGFSESSQEAIASAALQAYLWGNPFVGTEHLLCGLAKTPSGLAYHVLRSWGVTYETLKSRVEGFISIQQQTVSTKEASTPLLNNYGRDLTALAKNGQLDPVISRENEIDRLLQVLSRRTKNNPVLSGEAGVGKTAIVEGLAERIVERRVPQKFFDARVVNLDINALVAGTRFRGDFEERLLGIIDEIKESENTLIFIDEIQTIVGAGGAGGALDAANILKPALARGELHCIGATTAEEYSQFIEDDAALERRFQPIFVNEPDIKTTVSILGGLKDRYESFHRVKFKKNTLQLAAKLAQRYLVDRKLPDSAIDVLDEAASRKSVSAGQPSPTAVKIEEKIEKIRKEKDKLVKDEDWQQALEMKEKEDDYLNRLEEISTNHQSADSSVIEEKDIAEIVSMMTGVPVEDITASEAQRLLDLEKRLGKKVVGQDKVLNLVSSVLRRSRVGLRDPNRPIGSFIFLGTSGVGKTLVAETLSEYLFDDPDSLIRIDMSEFSERHTVARLIGAPPGYVGFEEGGQLTERLKHKPYSVVLFDEIEKAHPEVFNILLQVLDNGHLVDGRGRVISFRNTVIIMTSNVGSHLIRKEGSLGFGGEKDSEKKHESRYQQISQKLTEELRKSFKVEFLNRVDSIVVFKPLTKKVAGKIAKLLIKDLSARLKEEQGMKLKIKEKVYSFIVEKGFSEEFGAREMHRVISENIEDSLSQAILSGKFQKGAQIQVRVEQDKITIN